MNITCSSFTQSQSPFGNWFDIDDEEVHWYKEHKKQSIRYILRILTVEDSDDYTPTTLVEKVLEDKTEGYCYISFTCINYKYDYKSGEIVCISLNQKV